MNSTSLLFCWFGLVASLLAAPAATAQDQSAPPTLKSVLLEQLRATHDREEWFVPVKIAIEGLTPEQAAWKDQTDNHSIVQLVNHLIFWDQQQLAKFKGEKPAEFNGDNKQTFAGLDKAAWEASVKQIDEVLSAWEK